MVRELEEKFQQVPETGCVLVNYSGMKADESNEVRLSVSEAGGRMRVVKNSMFALAMERAGAPELKSLLEGPVAVITADNPVTAAKAARQALEACEAIAVRGGYVEGNIVDPERVEALADIPGREELLSKIAGAFLAPLRNLAGGLVSKQRDLLAGLEKLRDQKQEQE
jgi:large subunit ribosomal protein L10